MGNLAFHHDISLISKSDLPLDGCLLHDASNMVGSLKTALTRTNDLMRRVSKGEERFKFDSFSPPQCVHWSLAMILVKH